MKVRIEVTAEDIANGVRQAADACPIALAIQRAVPDANYIEVDENTNIELDGFSYHSAFPSEASRFMADFDAANPVLPFAFDAEFEPRVYGYGDEGSNYYD